MITRLHLENFKAWKAVDLEFGQLTGIFGTNSSGKSSLFQFLLMLKQTRNATDPAVTLNFGGPDQLVNLGSYRDLIHRHDQSLALSWTVSWYERHRRPFRADHPSLRSAPEHRLESSVRLRGSAPETIDLCYHVGDHWIGIRRAHEADGYEFINNDGPIEEVRRLSSHRGGRIAPAKSYVLPTHYWAGASRTKDTGSRKDRQVIRQLRIAPFLYEIMMDSISYLGPLRARPHRFYRFGGVRPTDVGTRGELTIDALLAATESGEELIDEKGRGRPFQEVIAHWLKEMGLVSGFRIVRIDEQSNLWRALVTTSPNGCESTLTDVGFGVSQVLPILVLLYHVPQGSIVLLEQPEIHLHPSAQAILADVFLHAAQTRDVQIVMESHSEHLLRRIQRRRAEGAEGSADVRLFFVSTGDSGAQLNDLELDRYGQIKNWPKDFFGDELAEVFAIQEAGMRRRMEDQA